MLQEDPLGGFRFRVAFGSESGFNYGFQRISGISKSRGERKWTELTETVAPVKLPSVMESSDITFSMGVRLGGTALETWFDNVTSNLSAGYTGNYSQDYIRNTVSIKAYAKDWSSYILYKLFDAYPKAIKIGDFNSMSQDLLIQQVVLAYEGYTAESHVADEFEYTFG
jgi:phage tail-like protein